MTVTLTLKNEKSNPRSVVLRIQGGSGSVGMFLT